MIKNKNVLWVVLLFLIILISFSEKKEAVLSIQTDGSAQRIGWTSPNLPPNLIGQVKKSMTFWVYQTGYINSYAMGIPNNGGEYFLINLNQFGDGQINIVYNLSVTLASWENRNNLITSGSWHFVAVTSDASLDTNVPILYVDNITYPLTVYGRPPSGSYIDTGGQVFRINGSVSLTGGATNSVIGKIADARVYNRILSPREIKEIFDARGSDNIGNGLVFKPCLTGGSSVLSFDNYSLTPSNKILDCVSGKYGTPVSSASGSPIGIAETYLLVK